MKGILGTTAIIIAALTAAPASAGTLFKCQGADGVTSYVSKRVPGARCSSISYTRDTRRPAAPRAVPAAAPVQTASTAPAPTPSQVASAERNPVAVAASAASPVVAATPAAAPAAKAAATPRGGRMVSGQVYSYMQDGVRHYTSARPTQVANLGPVRTIRYSFMERCYACGVNPRVDFGSVRLNTTAFQTEIASAAREFGVEEAIVRAIIHAESAYNPTALSRAGAQGLMQLMPPTAARFGVSDSYDASQNIRGGVQYLAWLLKRFNGDLTLAAAGYNAGEGAVDRHGGVPPYSETQYYVRRVGQLVDRYRTELSKQ
ncbi:lytic transglycosylase domain-containing protein [Stenotrophomonas sp. ZAC14A_NAIMI4_1]|uniref:lytic transglycosylase domain-containing protein n=1 Tax=Stenotrophomonas sp. ZAC14A_NAIMI4_1 TaxID=2072412 RepID=UPI000D541CAA|nr:lytic transglycosylase domain-containing protein [Stenotrophomonas sp. ZAC14A_NAIMI4_1]AWH46107.1 transglycosylase [Stenotrophomonas sp. ZAC14A_NAIMI4_1]